MSAREWKPGDMAMVECSDGEWRQATCEPHANHNVANMLVWRFPDRVYRDVDNSKARPLVVIDPEDREQVQRVINLMQQRGWTGLDAEAPDDMQNVLRDLATPPTRDEPQPEPLDPGVRVRDKDGREWARSTTNGVWMSALVFAATWADLLHDRRPLTIITPAPEPTPDERPFVAGERVRVSSAARSPLAGRVVRFWVANPDGTSLVYEDGTPRFRHRVSNLHLTHADAPC